MRSHPTVSEVARNFSAYIDRVIHRGEHFLVMKDRKPIAELRPVDAAEGLRLGDLPGLLSSLPHLGSDVDAFESDLTAARREVDQLSPRNPWES
jgi:antitoxin (DNA-binding transcriptional repressor) of toxin-antitoxin stability system